MSLPKSRGYRHVVNDASVRMIATTNPDRRKDPRYGRGRQQRRPERTGPEDNRAARIKVGCDHR